MKNIASLLILLFCVTFAFDGNAQMSKKEQKEWKKRIKALSPEQYKTLLDDNKSLKSQNASLKAEVAGVDGRIADKDNQISNLQDQVADLKDQLADALARPEPEPQRTAGPAVGAGINDQEGIVFKVQIGAFKQKDLSKYLDAGDNFSGETDENGLRRYSLGVFREYWDADTFKKYLREMGVKGAFIVSYRDGQRVDIKDVLESIGEKGE
ncbi:MAG: Ezrin/radixin/moesin family protein [Cytophagales bacterium]|nr:Ezrin/radixin/moesin family protein [Cytophagales bacterium]